MKIDFEHGIKLLGLERKYNKLRRDPELFLRDMVFKRSNQIKKYVPMKYKGENKFTIVSAVYNVEKYLDEYFESIVKQSLDFKKHIYIICIDDGSTDCSAKIIKKWQKKYPKNIQYIYKTNGGQSSARNLGLEYVKTDWVTFIDPDDYLNTIFFEEIDKNILSFDDLKIIVANMHFYMEDTKSINDTHPLRYRFHGVKKVFDIDNLEGNFNVSAASSIFKYDVIRDYKIGFDENVKPNFEDGKFIADYLLECQRGKVSFNSNSIYFYRKRADNSSTLNNSWQKPEKYLNVLEHGHLAMLKKYHSRKGIVPLDIQRTTLYDVIWYVKYLLNDNAKINFLSESQKEKFFELISDIFSYIDTDTIWKFYLIRTWYFHKVALFGLFKNAKPYTLFAYIESVDRVKKQVLINYFTYFDDLCESFQLDGIDIIPTYEKTIAHEFVGKKFVSERRVWLPYNNEEQKFQFYLDGNKVTLALKGKEYKGGISIENIINQFPKSRKYSADGSWVLMDRDFRADDNAEHLYRFIRKFYPEQRCYFALREDSIDWNRLSEEGFNLIKYASQDFESKLRACSIVISSQLDNYIYSYFNDEYELDKKFVFLQHGIIPHDLSLWINTKNNISKFITSTQSEYDSIVRDNTSYKLTKKEVVLTGLPRHDALIANDKPDNKSILIMPTWRVNIVGKTSAHTNSRSYNEAFMQSTYAQAWFKFIHNPNLRRLSEEFGYKIIFAPHPNIAPYLNEFLVPEYISTVRVDNQTVSIQTLLNTSKIMITDYSSVAFEMGLLKKMVIYYQFDYEEIFSTGHIYRKGYFDYSQDGFGPIAYDEEKAFRALENILKNDGKACDPYITRMKETFPFRDGKNCERVYQAILSLEQPEQAGTDISILKQFIANAYNSRDWILVKTRSERLIELEGIEGVSFAKDMYIESLVKLQGWRDLEQFLTANNYYGYQWIIYFAQGKWKEVLKQLELTRELSLLQKVVAIQCAAELKDIERTRYFASLISDEEHSKPLNILISALLLLAERNWSSLAEYLEKETFNDEASLDLSSREVLDKQYQTELKLLLSRAYRHQFLIEEACEKWKVDQAYAARNFIEKAKTCFLKGNTSEVAVLLKEVQLQEGNAFFFSKTILMFAQALLEQEDWAYLHSNLPDWINLHPHQDELRVVYVNTLMALHLWQEIIETIKTMPSKERVIYPLVLAFYRLGDIENAYKSMVKPSVEHPYEYWKIISELAILKQDFIMAELCLKTLLSRYPERDRLENWERFNQLLLLTKG